MEIITKSPEETKSLGKKLSADLVGGEIIALSGDVGSGKTTFAQGMAEGLGILQRLISPTFILVRKYEVEIRNLKEFYHVDLYRLDGDVEKEIENLGLTDIWGKKDNATVVEWAEKIKNVLPKETRWINFKVLGKNLRAVTMSNEK